MKAKQGKVSIGLALEFVAMLATMAGMLFLIGAGFVVAGKELIACCRSPYGLLTLLAVASPWLFCRLLMAFIDANMQHHNSSPRIYPFQANIHDSGSKNGNSGSSSAELTAGTIIYAHYKQTDSPGQPKGGYDNIGCWW